MYSVPCQEFEELQASSSLSSKGMNLASVSIQELLRIWICRISTNVQKPLHFGAWYTCLLMKETLFSQITLFKKYFLNIKKLLCSTCSVQSKTESFFSVRLTVKTIEPSSGFIKNKSIYCVYWTVHHLDTWIKIDQLDVTCFIISLFTAQLVSNVSTSIFRGLRLIVDLFHVLYCSGSMCVGVMVWFSWGGVVSFCRLRH